MKTASPKKAPLSVSQIADRTGHSIVAIHKAINRHNITPEVVTPSGYRYFDESTVAFLKENMRPARRTA